MRHGEYAQDLRVQIFLPNSAWHGEAQKIGSSL
jgi:hypothetical protein